MERASACGLNTVPRQTYVSVTSRVPQVAAWSSLDSMMLPVTHFTPQRSHSVEHLTTHKLPFFKYLQSSCFPAATTITEWWSSTELLYTAIPLLNTESLTTNAASMLQTFSITHFKSQYSWSRTTAAVINLGFCLYEFMSYNKFHKSSVVWWYLGWSDSRKLNGGNGHPPCCFLSLFH